MALMPFQGVKIRPVLKGVSEQTRMYKRKLQSKKTPDHTGLYYRIWILPELQKIAARGGGGGARIKHSERKYCQRICFPSPSFYPQFLTLETGREAPLFYCFILYQHPTSTYLKLVHLWIF